MLKGIMVTLLGVVLCFLFIWKPYQLFVSGAQEIEFTPVLLPVAIAVLFMGLNRLVDTILRRFFWNTRLFSAEYEKKHAKLKKCYGNILSVTLISMAFTTIIFQIFVIVPDSIFIPWMKKNSYQATIHYIGPGMDSYNQNPDKSSWHVKTIRYYIFVKKGGAIS